MGGYKINCYKINKSFFNILTGCIIDKYNRYGAWALKLSSLCYHRHKSATTFYSADNAIVSLPLVCQNYIGAFNSNHDYKNVDILDVILINEYNYICFQIIYKQFYNWMIDIQFNILK